MCVVEHARETECLLRRGAVQRALVFSDWRAVVDLSSLSRGIELEKPLVVLFACVVVRGIRTHNL